jgi:hypothetical protein
MNSQLGATEAVGKDFDSCETQRMGKLYSSSPMLMRRFDDLKMADDADIDIPSLTAFNRCANDEDDEVEPEPSLQDVFKTVKLMLFCDIFPVKSILTLSRERIGRAGSGGAAPMPA